jgi:hypothetical protein
MVYIYMVTMDIYKYKYIYTYDYQNYGYIYIWCIYTGWWFGTSLIFHFIYGMSSFPLTHIFHKGFKPPKTMVGTLNDMWNNME